MDISDVLLRIRLRKYVFVADIANMYRQNRVIVLISIFFDTNFPTKRCKSTIYAQLHTEYMQIHHTYSHQMFATVGHEQESILSSCSRSRDINIYVYDIVTRADNIEDVLTVQVISLLRLSSFELKKWTRNCAEIHNNILVENQILDLFFKSKDEDCIKVVGLQVSDVFGYHVNTEEGTPTKCYSLSTIFRLYDQVGALGSVSFKNYGWRSFSEIHRYRRRQR